MGLVFLVSSKTKSQLFTFSRERYSWLTAQPSNRRSGQTMSLIPFLSPLTNSPRPFGFLNQSQLQMRSTYFHAPSGRLGEQEEILGLSFMLLFSFLTVLREAASAHFPNTWGPGWLTRNSPPVVKSYVFTSNLDSHSQLKVKCFLKCVCELVLENGM